MPERATALTPEVLRWARVTAGLSVSDIASKLGKTPKTINAWETGEEYPTYNQLEILSDRYKRPIAIFFLPEPPVEPPVESEFRTLPEADIEGFHPDTRWALRDATAFQESLGELTDDKNPSNRLITRDIRVTPSTDPARLAQRVRDYLAVSIASQKAFKDTARAMAGWRMEVEAVGVFVFKRSFKQKGISGFCLADAEFPVIVINNSTAFTRQIFTLFHELAHLLLGVSSITSEDKTLLDRLTPRDRKLEVVANRFAAEFLLPTSHFPFELFANTRDVRATVERVASDYKVSRELVARRLLDTDLIDAQTYSTWVNEWNKYKGRGGDGGDYYATQATYLGPAFLSLAFGQYDAGNINAVQLADHLHIKAKNVGKLESFLLERDS